MRVRVNKVVDDAVLLREAHREIKRLRAMLTEFESGYARPRRRRPLAQPLTPHAPAPGAE